MSCGTQKVNIVILLFLEMKNFGIYENKVIEVGSIPSDTEVLEFKKDFNLPLKVGVIPDGIVSLTFGGCFNQPLGVGVIPSGVKSLIFGGYFNQPLVAGVIPGGVKSLVFGGYFNQPLVAGVIPGGVKSLVFGYCFNQPLGVGVIPSGVVSLTFRYNFDQDLIYLPDTIVTLGISHPFNSKIKFPLELKFLEILNYYCTSAMADHPILDSFKNDRRILLHKEKCSLVKNLIEVGYISFITKNIIL